MKTKDDRMRYYTTIYTQATSPCGNYLAVAGSYKRISVIELETVLGPRQSEEEEKVQEAVRRKVIDFEGGENDAWKKFFCSEASNLHYICGDSTGRIHGVEWSTLTEDNRDGALCRPAWSFQATEGAAGDCMAEVNVLKLHPGGEKILSGGAGDNALKLWDMETRTQIVSLTGHKNYIHKALFRSENEVASCSEDGTAKIWDLRTKTSVREVNPSSSKCNRNFGAYISCLAVDGDWLICGGGPSLGMWHLSSMSLAVTMDDGEMEHRDLFILDDKIINAGNKPKLLHWNFRGDLVAEILTDMPGTYNIHRSQRNEDYHVLTTVGTSSKVNFYVDSNYKAFSLETWP